MFTSLNVVRMAAVDCDCTRRSATRWRKRDIGTRCSGRPLSSAVSIGAFTSGSAGRAASAKAPAALAAVAAAGAAAKAAGCSADNTSPLVMRPSRPVPTTCEAARPASASRLAAAGIGAAACAKAPAAKAAGAVAARAAGAVAAAGLPAAALAEAGSIIAITSPATTVLPSGLTICASVPAAGAGTSRTTLSVSTSINTSSSSTRSPAFFFHCSSVASETDSDSCGTLTSTIEIFLCSDRIGSTVQHQALELGERRIDQRLLLLDVLRVVADRRRSRGRAPGVAKLVLIAHLLQQVMLHVEPRTHVLRLVLAPDDVGQIGQALEFGSERLVRERIQLFDPDQRRIVGLSFFALGLQLVVHLARTQDRTPHFLRVAQRGVGNHGAELAARQIHQLGGRVLVSQQGFGRHDHQGLAEHPDHLAPQQVEYLRRQM